MTVGTVEIMIAFRSYYSEQVEKNLDGRSQYISIPIHSLLLVGSLLITSIKFLR